MRKMHPLHTVDFITEYMRSTGEYFPVERRTGRSTAQALRTVAYCLQNPNRTVAPVDHAGTAPANVELVRTCCRIVESLGMIGFGSTRDTLWFGTPSPNITRL